MTPAVKFVLSAAIGLVCFGAGTARSASEFKPNPTNRTARSSNPSLVGEWSDDIDFPSRFVHMHVLPNGRILTWTLSPGGSDPTVIDVDTMMWDPSSNPSTLTDGTAIRHYVVHYDIFCSGHAFCPDGRLMVAGGGHVGTQAMWMFDFRKSRDWSVNPSPNPWAQGPSMPDTPAQTSSQYGVGRYYPTVRALPTGKMMVVSGDRFGQANPVPQVWTDGSSSPWESLSYGHDGESWQRWYPFMFVAPNGWLFRAGGTNFPGDVKPTGQLNPQTGDWTPLPTTWASYNGNQMYASAVQFDRGKILLVGGGNTTGGCPTNGENVSADVGAAYTIDLTAATPTWRGVNGQYELIPREYAYATVLPDGKVLEPVS